MDAIKKELALRVQGLILNTNWNNIGGVEDKSNSANAAGSLETKVRIWTRYGPRYFVVKVKEEL